MYAVSGTTYTITGLYKKNLYFGQAIGLEAAAPELPSSKVVEVPTS